MAHSFNTSDLVARGTKQALHAKGMLLNTCDHSYGKHLKQETYTSGQTITVDIDPQATITTGRVGILQDRKHTSLSGTIVQYNGVFATTSIQKAFDTDGEAGVVRYGRTIGLRLVREIERTGFQHAAEYFGNAVGTPGSEPGSFRTWATAASRIEDQLADGRIYGAMSPLASVALADSLKHAVNPGKAISNQYVSAAVRHMAGIDFYKSNSTYRHTAGTADNTTPLVDGAPSNGSSTLHIDGTTNGDIANNATHFTVGTVGGSDAVYAIDPESKDNLPYLKKFAITTTTSASSGSGDVDITVSEPFYDSTDSRQNVSQLPPDGATITFDTEDAEQTQANIVYAPDALSLITAPLASDSTGALKESFQSHGPVQIRTAIHPRDSINDQETLRVDGAWVWISPRPNHGCVVWGG